MKTRTEKILTVLKVLAFAGGIGFSIDCGAQLLTFVASIINLDWAKHTMDANQSMFRLHDYNIGYYVSAALLVIILLALKAFIWYIIADLLLKLQMNSPFTMAVTKKLEKIAFLLLGIWVIGAIGKIYMNWLSKTTGIPLADTIIADEYLFVAGIVYIVSQIFKRGIEIQEENQLTV